MTLGFFFNSRTDGLDISYGGNVFDCATLEKNFLVLDLGDCYNNKISLPLSHILILILILLNGMLDLDILVSIG